jgi:hypothetical protein
MGSRGGRPRKLGIREPSGRLSRVVTRPAGEPISGAKWQRIRQAWSKIFGEEDHGSELGRLSFYHEITDAQAAAGFRIGDVYRKYHRLKGLRDTAKSPSYQSGSGGSSDLAEERMSSEQLAAFEGQIRKAEADWKAVDDVLSNSLPHRSFDVPRNLKQAVIDVCVFDTPVNPMLYPDLRGFLDHMAVRNAGRNAEIDKNDKARRRSPIEVRRAEPRREPRREDAAAVAVQSVLRKLWPDIEADAMRKVTETFQALRSREEFRRHKARER